MIPGYIAIRNKTLPDEPGVYFYYDVAGKLLYVGKATSLRSRVGSYFTKAHENRIADMVAQIQRIDYIVTPTVIEALVLEANQIKAKKPKYNILQRDDKSFLYLVITNEPYPKPVLMRGHELERLGIDPFRTALTAQAKRKFLRVFGPYPSGASLKKALDLIRRAIPWSDCNPPSVTGRHRPCFNVHLEKCPGVCTGAITQKAYRAIIRQLVLFFDGKKKVLMRAMERNMKRAADALKFEEAAAIRRHVYALQHIQDVALISREDIELPYATSVSDEAVDLDGRIEAYDISHISGTSAVGSMIVFEEGKPTKSLYRKFKIKTVIGPDDVGMLEEMMRRRLARTKIAPKAWPLPQIMVIDGGEGQVRRVQDVMNELGIQVPLMGIAKGFDRKQDRLVFDHSNLELLRVAKRGKELFQWARDEAHRFAVSYHRSLRLKRFFGAKR
ncbi:excinuclease ABC subunit UvrC [Candidatus Uhrbacteria bacterium]|nr:excinuclease ABC subunit UvrC [Candidatus Uhrbacteria bacterium]